MGRIIDFCGIDYILHGVSMCGRKLRLLLNGRQCKSF